MNALEGFEIYNYHQQLLLSQKMVDARKVINEFFSLFPQEAAREYLWFMLSTALKADNEELDAFQRANMLFFYDCLLILFTANEVLKIDFEK